MVKVNKNDLKEKPGQIFERSICIWKRKKTYQSIDTRAKTHSFWFMWSEDQKSFKFVVIHFFHGLKRTKLQSHEKGHTHVRGRPWAVVTFFSRYLNLFMRHK